MIFSILIYVSTIAARSYVHPGTAIPPDRVDSLKNPGAIYSPALSQLDTTLTFDTVAISTDVDKPSRAIAKYYTDGTQMEFRIDGDRAYRFTIAYLVNPSKKEYANAAQRLINDWATKCKSFSGPNAPPESGWGLAGMAKSAELLKYKYPEWSKNTEADFKRFVKDILMPNLKQYETTPWIRAGNWGSTIIQARLQFAIFAEDDAEMAFAESEAYKITDRLLDRTKFNGNEWNKDPSHNIVIGHNAESKRDLAHAAFEIGGLVDIAETLKNQKSQVDLYGYRSNILKAGVEYQARLILGDYPEDIKPWIATLSGEEYKKWIGGWFPHPMNWEMAVNHYTKREGQSMPRTKQLLTAGVIHPLQKRRTRCRPELFLYGIGLSSVTHLKPS